MNTGIIIIGVVLVGFSTVPFILMGMKSKKKSQWFLQQLKELASKHHAEITRFDFCRDFILGIDENKHQLFYFQFLNQTEKALHIRLSEMTDCKLINHNRTLENVTVVDQLILIFKSSGKSKEEIKWMIYSSDDHAHLDDELQLMNKWVPLIKKHLGK